MKSTITLVTQLGIQLERWKYKSCTADFGVSYEEKWATLYYIHSKKKRLGHATKLLTEAKQFYEKEKMLTFGGSVALNDNMRRLYQKLKIKEYKDEV